MNKSIQIIIYLERKVVCVYLELGAGFFFGDDYDPPAFSCSFVFRYQTPTVHGTCNSFQNSKQISVINSVIKNNITAD